MHCAGFGSVTVTHSLSTRCSRAATIVPRRHRCRWTAAPLNEGAHLDRPGREALPQKLSAACREAIVW